MFLKRCFAIERVAQGFEEKRPHGPVCTVCPGQGYFWTELTAQCLCAHTLAFTTQVLQDRTESFHSKLPWAISCEGPAEGKGASLCILFQKSLSIVKGAIQAIPNVL